VYDGCYYRRRRFAAIDYGQPIIPIMVDDAYFFPPSVRCTHTLIRVRVERSIRVPFVHVHADKNGAVFYFGATWKLLYYFYFTSDAVIPISAVYASILYPSLIARAKFQEKKHVSTTATAVVESGLWKLNCKFAAFVSILSFLYDCYKYFTYLFGI